jgi:plastocyanin
LEDEMDALDSRFLRNVDCFGQKFSSPGKVRYHLTAGGEDWLPSANDAFSIEVKKGCDASGKGKQHDVTVHRKGKRLLAEPPHLEIEAGDLVLWHTNDSTIAGFGVRGETERKGEGFDSSELTETAVYSHAFGSPGEYRWADAHGSRLSGLIEVKTIEGSDKNQMEKWRAALGTGAIITITGNKATPEKLQVLVGQTVFWAVEKAPGITITGVQQTAAARRKQ